MRFCSTSELLFSLIYSGDFLAGRSSSLVPTILFARFPSLCVCGLFCPLIQTLSFFSGVWWFLSLPAPNSDEKIAVWPQRDTSSSPAGSKGETSSGYLFLLIIQYKYSPCKKIFFKSLTFLLFFPRSAHLLRLQLLWKSHRGTDSWIIQMLLKSPDYGRASAGSKKRHFLCGLTDFLTLNWWNPLKTLTLHILVGHQILGLWSKVESKCGPARFGELKPVCQSFQQNKSRRQMELFSTAGNDSDFSCHLHLRRSPETQIDIFNPVSLWTD